MGCGSNGGGIAGMVGFDHATYAYVPDFVEFDAVDGSGSAVTSRVLQGINEAGLDHVLIASVDQDLGAEGGVAVARARVRLTPSQQRSLFGGDVWHTYAATPTYHRNTMPVQGRLNPGEDLLVEYAPRTAGSTSRVRVMRYRAFRRR